MLNCPGSMEEFQRSYQVDDDVYIYIYISHISVEMILVDSK